MNLSSVSETKVVVRETGHEFGPLVQTTLAVVKWLPVSVIFSGNDPTVAIEGENEVSSAVGVVLPPPELPEPPDPPDPPEQPKMASNVKESTQEKQNPRIREGPEENVHRTFMTFLA